MGFKNAAQRKAVWASKNEQKKGSPAKHCASDMMHSGGWQEMRKHNSPNTIGNKPAIKHNEKMRQKIGTFKMPHSPLNKGHEVNKDSIAAAKAWKEHKAAYLKKPNGQKEYDMEKGEFYYSPKHGKLRLIPTDDGEVQDRSGIEKWQLAPDRKSSRKIPGQDLDKVQVDERGEYAVNMHNRQDTIRPADGKNFKPFIQGKQSGKMESGYLSDDDYTIKDGKISPINQESEAEKRRRERAENEPGETQFFYNRKSKPLGEAEKYGSTSAMGDYTKTDEQVYNMTPDATPEESKAVRDKFDATYLKGRGPFQKKKEGKKDACYHKVKSRVKVWPSAYASGQLVQCRKAGAANWGEKSKDK